MRRYFVVDRDYHVEEGTESLTGDACQKTNGLKSSDQSPNVIFELPAAQVFQIEPQASCVVYV
jgi:hypothetical protein